MSVSASSSSSSSSSASLSSASHPLAAGGEVVAGAGTEARARIGAGKESSTAVSKKRKRVVEDAVIEPLNTSGLFVVTSTQLTKRTDRLKFWDAVNKNLIFEQDFSDKMSSYYFCAVTNVLVCASMRTPGCIRAFDLNTRKLKYRIQHDSFGYINDVSVNVSGTKFMTHIQQGENIFVWDLATGRQVMEIVTPEFTNFRASFTNDIDNDRIVSMDSKGCFHVWNADTGVKILSFPGLAGSIYALSHIGQPTVAVALNQPWCAAYANGVLGVWNYQTTERLFANGSPSDSPFYVHECWFAFGPDDNSIFSLSRGELRSWDIATGTLLSQFPGYYGSNFVFNPCSKSIFIMSNTSSKTVVEIDATAGHQIASTDFESWVRWISYSSAPVTILL
jgi:WD40 repeat protein